MVCEQGDVIALSFDPSPGHESAKRRPAVVLSATDYNMSASMTVVAPITSVNNGYPMHCPLLGYDEFAGYACIEQLRAVDLEARHATVVGRVSDTDLNALLELVGATFAI